MLLTRSWNPIRKGLVTERTWCALTNPAVRHYVGLAPQSSPTENARYSMADPAENGPRNTINAVTTGLGATGKSEPEFNIVSTGVGSLLMVKLPPDTEITAATGTAVGSSNQVFSKLTLDGGSISAVSRRALGDKAFRQKYETRKEYGDVLLAPSTIGEIAIININGSTEYAMRRDAFLAKTSRVSVDLGFSGLKGKETGVIQRIAHKVRGPGTIAISHYGGLYRIVLDENEEYLVNPSHLVAWDTRTAPTKLYRAKPTIPSPRSRLRRYHVFRNIVDSPSMQSSLQFWDGVFRQTRNWVLGAPDFVRMKGPGDFYLSSRVEPRFAKSRLLNAISQADDSVDQAMSQATIFPTGAAPPKDPKKPHLGYATEKSSNGEITYYASVGSNGRVSFTPAKQLKVNSAEGSTSSL
ncbi:mitochondrial biogenesis AIM24-domain-containing protein [Umbelopsis sp. AD052]|nr:mitochondrial biogenesis AIM24-domain-containing protein [Umbelopsis sp. AD052]